MTAILCRHRLSLITNVTHMKNLLLIFFLVSYTFAAAQSTDEESIQQVITSAYIEGIQNGGSADDIRKGIHPTFAMLRLIDNEIKPYPLEEWIAALEKQKKEARSPVPPRAEGKFISTDITGSAAVVKLELYRGGKKTFTDYLVLYKFTEGWRIVSKTFFRHPN